MLISEIVDFSNLIYFSFIFINVWYSMGWLFLKLTYVKADLLKNAPVET